MASGQGPENAQALKANPYAAPQLAPDLPAPVAVSPGGEMSPELLDELQRVANYRQMHKRLRNSGIGSVLFGLWALYIGINGLRYTSINAILVAIGVFLLVEGLWLIIKPAPIGVILDGAALLLVGVWNIGIQILNAVVFHVHSGFWPIIGIIQIAWGIQALKRYPRFSKMPRVDPSPDILKRIDVIAKGVQKSKMSSDAEVIDFQIVTFLGRQPWKGRLRTGFAAFVGPSHFEVLFARPADVEFAPERKAILGKSMTGQLRIADRTFKATFPSQSLQRYQAWQQVNQPARAELA